MKHDESPNVDGMKVLLELTCPGIMEQTKVMVQVVMDLISDMCSCTCAAHGRMLDIKNAHNHVGNQTARFLEDHHTIVANTFFAPTEQAATEAKNELMKRAVFWSRDETEKFLKVK